MPYEIETSSGARVALPASLELARLDLQPTEERRIVRGFGATVATVLRTDRFEVRPAVLEGVVATDRDAITLESLVGSITSAARTAVRLWRTQSGADVSYLLVDGGDVDEEPTGVDGSRVTLSVVLFPTRGVWRAAGTGEAVAF